MELEYKQVQGSQAEKPIEFEINIDTVYYRKNIQKVTQTNETGEQYDIWQYDEAILPLRDWLKITYGGSKQ